jgi:rare lipoprotein A
LSSLLRMLLVAGVFVVSLATVQVEEAHADPMLSSWYGPGLEGNLTAHPYLPMGTKLEVCYVDCTVVRVNDRGPYVAGRDLDLSEVAAEDIGLTTVGTDVVDVEVLE